MLSKTGIRSFRKIKLNLGDGCMVVRADILKTLLTFIF